jgi:hypothetical protein
MIRVDYVEVFVNKYNYKKIYNSYYKYLNIEINTFLKIPIKYLPLGSGYKVEINCDYCNSIFKIEYRKYIKSIKEINKCSCNSKLCYIKKTKETNIKKYGVDNVMHLTENKTKIKKTNLIKYGVEHFSKTTEFNQKVKKTNKERYGVEHLLSSDFFKNKYKKTSIDRYGVDNPFKNDLIKEKIKKTNLKKYGVDNYSKSSNYLLKVKSTNLKKYGIEIYSKSNESKLKTKKKFIEKYGVDNPMKLDYIKEKVNNTNLSRYGFKSAMNSPKIANKVKKTNLLKYGFENSHKSEKVRDKFILANDPDYIRYKDFNISIFWCKFGHEFEIKSHNYFSRKAYNTPLCTICNPIGDSKSVKEKELFEFISSVYNGKIIQSYRDKLEIDIYLPSLNIGFEFNGLYWHSDQFKNKNYHLSKLNYFSKKNIKIINIWEDDWVLENKKVKDNIKYILSKSIHISSENCLVKEINNKLDIKLELYYNNEIIGSISLNQYDNNIKMKKDEWNIYSTCFKLNSRANEELLNYFILNYKPSKIITYLDNDSVYNDFFINIGFKSIIQIKPNYKYILNNKREEKKDNILEESHKIWDCGKVKMEITF